MSLLEGLVKLVAELSGLAWPHGYADAFDADFRGQYEVNQLGKSAEGHSIRSESSKSTHYLSSGNELGGQGSDPSNDEAEMREIQQRVAEADVAKALFSRTSQ
jgi:hypothetical protein